MTSYCIEAWDFLTRGQIKSNTTAVSIKNGLLDELLGSAVESLNVKW